MNCLSFWDCTLMWVAIACTALPLLVLIVLAWRRRPVDHFTPWRRFLRRVRAPLCPVLGHSWGYCQPTRDRLCRCCMKLEKL
jgi:hypothetical protein